MRTCLQPLNKLHHRWRLDKSTNGRFDCNIKAQCITQWNRCFIFRTNLV